MDYDFSDITENEKNLLKSKKIVKNNLLKKEPILTSKIDYYASFYNLLFNEVIYLIINDVKNKITCKECYKNKPKFISTKKGYKKYCSTKCSNNNKKIQEKKKKTYIKKYGVDNPSKSNKIKKKISKKASNQSNKTKEKRKKTCLIKYGYITNLNLPHIKEKTYKLLKEKYYIRNKNI